jgi:hypothetical protein
VLATVLTNDPDPGPVVAPSGRYGERQQCEGVTEEKRRSSWTRSPNGWPPGRDRRISIEVTHDLVGLWHAKLGVEIRRPPPVILGALIVAFGLVHVSETAVRARLLVPVARLDGQGERPGVTGAGLAGSDPRQ